jgi:intergrase/recombinase
LPSDYGNIILFTTLTGLRPDEALKALSLLKEGSTEYIDCERMMLLHYRFPDMFLRVSKKAFVSIINKDLIEIGNATPMDITYSSVRKRLKGLNISMHLYYCRKVFATYLRNKGIEPEIIDLLQGRISDSVFVNHYYRPDINEIITKRIRPVLDELRRELTA